MATARARRTPNRWGLVALCSVFIFLCGVVVGSLSAQIWTVVEHARPAVHMDANSPSRAPGGDLAPAVDRPPSSTPRAPLRSDASQTLEEAGLQLSRMMWFMTGTDASDAAYYPEWRSDVARAAALPSCQRYVRVLVYNAHLGRSAGRAREGASMGELIYYNSVLRAMSQLCVHVSTASSEAEGEPLLRALVEDPSTFDAVVADVYSLVSIIEITDRVLPARRGQHPGLERIKCKLRLMDVWGTPKQQNWYNLHLQQFLIPFAMTPPPSPPWNTVTGYVLELPPPRAQTSTKKLQGYVWGKEPRYFEKHKGLLQAIGRVAPLVAAAKPEADAALRAAGVTNLGILAYEQRARVLEESMFVLSLGDPVLGLSPFEGMRHGCVYLDAAYERPRRLDDNQQFPLTSQHPFALEAGAPHAFPVRLWQQEEVLRAVREAVRLQQATPGGVGPWVPPHFALHSVAGVLERNLGTNFCTAGPPAPEEFGGIGPERGAPPNVPAPLPPERFTRRLAGAGGTSR